jgi:transcriptional regulator of acetoin/glycerol metabolism
MKAVQVVGRSEVVLPCNDADILTRFVVNIRSEALEGAAVSVCCSALPIYEPTNALAVAVDTSACMQPRSISGHPIEVATPKSALR